MKLSYKKYPILRFTNEEFIKENAEFFRQLILESPNNTLEEKTLNILSKLIMINGILTKKPIYFISDSFLEAVIKNECKLRQLYEKEYKETLEDYIIIGSGGNIFVQTIIDDNKQHFLWLNPKGEIICSGTSEFMEDKTKYATHIAMSSSDLNTCCNTRLVILFKKFASVDLEIVEAGTKKKSTIAEKGKVINELGVDVTLLDSRWFREIIRKEGFKVSGHFRLQPCKNEQGEWTRKLIYIEEFEKHGYHRRAQISIENEEIDG